MWGTEEEGSVLHQKGGGLSEGFMAEVILETRKCLHSLEGEEGGRCRAQAEEPE